MPKVTVGDIQCYPICLDCMVKHDLNLDTYRMKGLDPYDCSLCDKKAVPGGDIWFLTVERYDTSTSKG